MSFLNSNGVSRGNQLVVVVPARDEAAEIVDCLAAIKLAANTALATGWASRVNIVVVAHCCNDATAVLASRALGLDGQVVIDDAATSVGQVRAAGVLAGTSEPMDSEHTWIFSTDADSRVPTGWFTSALQFAGERSLQVVAGVTALRHSELPPAVLTRYDEIVSSQRRAVDDHDHVYGANLAVRLDAYLKVGGFNPLYSGEDVDLVRRCRAAGLQVGTPTSPSVLTSARTMGRAPLGVAELITNLTKEAV